MLEVITPTESSNHAMLTGVDDNYDPAESDNDVEENSATDRNGTDDSAVTGVADTQNENDVKYRTGNNDSEDVGVIETAIDVIDGSRKLLTKRY